GGPVHPAENGEVPFFVDAGRIGADQEELRAVAARTPVRHGYRALGVGLGAVCLVGELVARATLSGACRVSTLQDEDPRIGQPMALGVIEVTLISERDE